MSFPHSSTTRYLGFSASFVLASLVAASPACSGHDAVGALESINSLTSPVSANFGGAGGGGGAAPIDDDANDPSDEADDLGGDGDGIEGGQDTEAVPLPTCADGLALQASGASFVAPTSQALAAALNELTFSPQSKPFTVAMLQRGEVGYWAAGHSAYSDGLFRQYFTEAHLPSVGTFTFIESELSSEGTQELGSLQLGVGDQAVIVAIENVSLDVTLDPDCQTAQGTLSAEIPPTQADLLLPLADGERTVQSLIDESDDRLGMGGSSNTDGPWQIRLRFEAAGVDFEFASFPLAEGR